MDVSILIATRRRPRLLADTLASLGAMTAGPLRYEVVVIDNAVDRETRAVVEAAPIPVRLLEEPVSGKNRALNKALPEIAGDLVVFTDDDVVVEQGWMGELWSAAQRWPAASIFGGRILPRWPADSRPPAEHPFFGHAFAIADFGHPEGRYSAGYVYGPNMAIRAAVFKDGWTFDAAIGPDGTERYISGSETSLTVALERAGHTAVYVPTAVVHHQIRPEQLTARWLHGRAFRLGRTQARRQGLTGGWRGVPRELIATAGREYASWWRCYARGDAHGSLDHALAYWTARGMIYHCVQSSSR